MPNVLITPHGGPKPRTPAGMCFRCVGDHLRLFWAGETPRNVATRQIVETIA